MPAVLNLSNEVVKMRAEVKRVKVLIIRKLTRQIGALRKKKGTAADLERNQRRAARLLEEVRVLKALVPDTVTKTALQSDISFEKVCKNKDASLSERAAARIATHPEFSRKIQSIKTAVEAFKAERTSAVGKKTENKSKGAGQTESQSDLDSEEEEVSEDEDHEEDQGFSEKIQKAEETSTLDASVSEKQAPSETHSTPPEVTRMRKEVKKLRVLIIRKITQQITNLKKAKAEDSEQQANQGCVAQLQKEIQVLRGLSPDKVTRRALEGNTDLEKVFQNPESSPAERVIARIATHPRFVKKRQDVQVAIEEERNKAAKADQANETEVKDEEVDGDDSEEEDDETDLEDGLDLSDNEDIKKTDAPLRCNVVKPNEDTKPAKDKPSTSKSKAGENEQVLKSPEQVTSSKTAVKPGVLQRPAPKTKEAAPPSKQVAKLTLKKPEKDDSESDLSDSEEEKEYFDDSTEERFHKQSSYSEQSDDDDDFFLGKVSKLKKKKSSGANAANTEKKGDPKETARSDKAQKVQEMSQFKMQTVFCSTLSKLSAGSQKGKHTGPKPARFQNQSKRSEEKSSWFKNQNAGTDERNFKNQEGPRQKGPVGPQRGKPAFERQGNKPGKHPQQALHPSWEASRKRKEQQAQILAFQGKKIKFDDDE